jgi:hypothetical protein
MKRINLLLIMLAFIAMGCNQGAKDEKKIKQELKDEIKAELEEDTGNFLTADEIKKIHFFGADNPQADAWKIEFYEEYGIYGWPDHLVQFFYYEDDIEDHKNLSDIINSESVESVSINVVNELGLQNIIVISKESCKCQIHDEVFSYKILWDEREGCGDIRK